MSDAMRELQAKCGVAADGQFGPNTAKAIAKFYQLSPEAASHFLGQCHHESGGFKRKPEENLNYSAKGLRSTFGRYFKTYEQAEEYARNPEKIANYVYMDENRKYPLGNTKEGDGWLWRGRGFIQCTGRFNYRAFASEMRLPEVMENPDLVATEYAMESAIWYFDKNNIWVHCKHVTDDTIKTVTKAVNGGTHGLDDRMEQTYKIHKWLAPD